MIEARSSAPWTRRNEPLARLRIWHLSLLVLYAAVALFDIQDQHMSEPVLITLASAGFAGYGLLAWLGWRFVLRFGDRLGLLPTLILYLVGMSSLFLAATIVYLGIEHAYRIGF